VSLTTSGMNAGTTKQKLNFVPNMPDTCLIPAPPPPAGPKGIPTPFPITVDTGKIAEKPVAKVKHKGGKVPNVDSVFKGVKGNEAGVGDLPPSTPKKDIVSWANKNKMYGLVGCPNVKCGGASFLMNTSPALGNTK
jgi:hypothetical protein